MKQFIVAGVIVLLSCMNNVALAVSYGPEAGEKIPHRLDALTHDGNRTSFEELRGENGLVLFFIRSADWCPYCKKQLLTINERVGEFKEQGYEIAVVSHDKSEDLAGFVEQHEIVFPLLADPESEIIRAFDILNTEISPDSRYYGVPHPGIFIISQGGIITAKFFEEGYKERPSLDDVLNAL